MGVEQKAFTREELLERARDLATVLRSRASYTEKLRRLPCETVKDLLSSGLYQVGIPRAFGGLDLDYRLILDAAVELGRGCASSSWCYSLWSAHAWLVGHWPRQAQEEVFGDGAEVLCSSSLNSGTSTTKLEYDGIRLTGRWEFVSGCDSANWVMVGVEGFEERTWVLVPREDFQILDTWFVSGLKGTGSKDIVIESAFVPHHRVLKVERAGCEDWTGWELHKQNRYRIPIPCLLGWDLVAPMLGITQGMIDEFRGRLIGTAGPGRTADSPAIHMCLSEAAAEMDAARIFLHHDICEIFKKAKQGGAFTVLDRARYRRDKAFITQLCLRSVNRLFDLSGGHALFDSVSLQRFHRDAQAVAHRDGLIMELGGQQYGRVALGLEPDSSI